MDSNKSELVYIIKTNVKSAFINGQLSYEDTEKILIELNIVCKSSLQDFEQKFDTFMMKINEKYAFLTINNFFK
jgi:hypothetical protein